MRKRAAKRLVGSFALKFVTERTRSVLSKLAEPFPTGFLARADLKVPMTHEGTEAKDSALDEMVLLVHDELRRLARHYLRGERPHHTIQPTALVNEAYIAIAEQSKVQWENRAHFIAIAARTMRHVLVDYARERGALKRGGELQRVTLHSRIRIDDGMWTSSRSTTRSRSSRALLPRPAAWSSFATSGA